VCSSDLIIATPPCQGVSLIGKNKSNEEMLTDDRNYLIFDAIDIIKKINPKAVLIENVARFLNIKYYFNDSFNSVKDIFSHYFSKDYEIKIDLFNSVNYGVPQNRNRAIIRMWKRNFKWEDPTKSPPISVRDAIGSLPSLESGQTTMLKNHNARVHTKEHIEFMRNTPTGKSAFENIIHFPRNLKTGERLRGFSATYKRIDWDKPCPTITMRNDCISSQSNVHPGRPNPDGSFSDARVLTLRELFILSSLNPDLEVPSFVSDIQIRNMVGEAVPPKLINAIVKNLEEINGK
jgi:DNA (cytosine-5)-methyltransferase 1